MLKIDSKEDLSPCVGVSKVASHLRMLMIGLSTGLPVLAQTENLEVALGSITSRVPPGGTVTLIIRTEPDATCAGLCQNHFGNDIPFTGEGQKGAGPDGRVSRSWKVLKGKHPVGMRNFIANCNTGNRQGTLKASFNVALD
jgi:hypothetical protein